MSQAGVVSPQIQLPRGVAVWVLSAHLYALLAVVALLLAHLALEPGRPAHGKVVGRFGLEGRCFVIGFRETLTAPNRSFPNGVLRPGKGCCGRGLLSAVGPPVLRQPASQSSAGRLEFGGWRAVKLLTRAAASIVAGRACGVAPYPRLPR